MAGGERFQVHSFVAVDSYAFVWDYPALRGPNSGLTMAFNANSNWLGTVAIDNGVGIVDVTSFFTGAASVGGAAGQKFFHKPGLTPWKVWLNVTSCPGGLNVAVGI